MKDAARPRIHTFLATSDIHLQYKLHKTREEILKMISWAVGHAKSKCQDVEFSPEDAGRTDRSYLIECCHAAVEAGATVLNLPDTVGFCLEPDYEQMFRDVQTRTREEILKMISWAVAHAKSKCQDVEFSPEDAGRTDRNYLIECCHAAVEAGATVLNLPDTVGFCLEPDYEQMFRDVQTRVPGMDHVTLSTHTHDDLGMAVANTLAGIRGGARQVECTINGIGERAGNAALEEVAMTIHVRRDALPVFTDIHSEELYASSRLLTRLTGMAVQRNKAIVGRNAFAHEAGIHQDGVLKNAITYEIITPQTVGMPSNSIVLGKHSGRHALAKRYEDLGYQLTKPELERAYALFTQLADRKKSIYDEDLLAIVNEGFQHIPEMFSLKLFQSVSSNEGRSTATVELEKDGETFHDSATGEGPCDAAFRAIDRITGMPGTISDFSVHTVGPGTDGVAEVRIRARFEGREFSGKCTSHSVVEAAARSYLQAANKAAYEMKRLEDADRGGHRFRPQERSCGPADSRGVTEASGVEDDCG